MRRKLNRFLAMLLCMAMTIALLPATMVTQSAAATGDVTVATPLYIEAKEADIAVSLWANGDVDWPVEYSTDGTTWTSYDLDNCEEIPLYDIGDRVYFRSVNTLSSTSDIEFSTGTYLNFFIDDGHGEGAGECVAGGNVMSLISTSFSTATTFPDGKSYVFNCLFADCGGLIDASALLLPATSLEDYCYRQMFARCSSLETAPALPATTMAKGCYYEMFAYCTSLKALTSSLPQVTLAEECYEFMFMGCTNLHVTTTANGCPTITVQYAIDYENEYYRGIFGVGEECCLGFEGDLLLATYYVGSGAVTLDTPANGTISAACDDGAITSGTVVVVGTEITLTATPSSSDYALGSWSVTRTDDAAVSVPVENNSFTMPDYAVTVSATFVDAALTTPLYIEAKENDLSLYLQSYYLDWPVEYSTDGTTWTSYDFDAPRYNMPQEITLTNIGDRVYFRSVNTLSSTSDIEFTESEFLNFAILGECVAGGNVMSLISTSFSTATTFPDGVSYVFNYLFADCSDLIDASALLLPATSLVDYCYAEMFGRCVSLETAPALPATTLAEGCYDNMFVGCTALTSLTSSLPQATLASGCYSKMFYGCTNLHVTRTPNGCPTITVQYALDYENEYYSGIFGAGEECCLGFEGDLLLATYYVGSGAVTLDTPANGTISAACDDGAITSGTVVVVGTEITLTATPSSSDYALGSWSVTRTDDAAVSVPVENNSFTMPDYAVTVSATFVDAALTTPLYFEAVGGGMKVGLASSSNSASWSGEYQTVINGTTSEWTSYVFGTTGSITLANVGDRVYFRTTADVQENDFAYNKYLYFYTSRVVNGSDSYVNVGGNIMSLMFNKDSFATATEIPTAYAFYKLFSGSTYIQDASALLLPATTLTESCYERMFYTSGYTPSLTAAPALPATTLAEDCYNWMFYGCRHLTAAPALPATTLAEGCYYWMFYNCTSLTAAPELPATTLAEDCYNGMFMDCTGLVTAPELPAETLAKQCYDDMFHGCSSLRTAPALPAETLAEACYVQMFEGCSSLRTAPALPATTLAINCYNSMFCACSSLTTAPALPAETLAENCYMGMFGQTALTAAPALPATTLAENCYNSMFMGCTALTVAPALPAETLASGCYTMMFFGCTALTAAPVLHAATLAENCYTYMFYGCSSLHVTKVETGGTIIIPSEGYDVADEYGAYPVDEMFSGCDLDEDSGAQAKPAVGEYIGGTFYTVTFNMQGHGDAIPAQTVPAGSAVTAPTAPTSGTPGLAFIGWYTDAECSNANKWNFSNTVSGNLTLYAKWSYFRSVTTSLKDNFWYNVYTNFKESQAAAINNYNFKYKIGDGELITLDLIAEYRGYYRLSVPLKPYQIVDDITIYIYENDNNESLESFTSSIMAYSYSFIDYYSDDAEMDSEIYAVKAMLNYGAAVQVWHDYKTDTLANARLDDADKKHTFG